MTINEVKRLLTIFADELEEFNADYVDNAMLPSERSKALELLINDYAMKIIDKVQWT